MLRSILFNCLWNLTLALPEFDNFQDMLTAYEYIVKKFKYGENAIYSNGHKYLDSLVTPSGDDENIVVQNNYDYSSKEVHNIPDVTFYLISRKREIYDLFNNLIISTIIQENKVKNIFSEEETFKRLIQILSEPEILKSICDLIYFQYQTTFKKTVKSFQKIFEKLISLNLDLIDIFMASLIKPLVVKYEYSKILIHDYKNKRTGVSSFSTNKNNNTGNNVVSTSTNYREYKEQIRREKRVCDSISKKITTIHEMFKNSKNDNVLKLAESIQTIFIDKYVVDVNRLEDVEYDEPQQKKRRNPHNQEGERGKKRRGEQKK
jgi:hypothetical protein